MSSLFADTHNVVAILKKSDDAEGFEQIIDFLSGSYIHYAFTVSPHIYISCIKQFWIVSVKRSGDVTSSKFYMYPHFIQLIIQNQVGDLSTHTTRFISLALTQKVFANMRRVGKGFSRVETPLFECLIAERQPAEEELGAEQVQGDAAIAAAVVEDVAEDVAQMATPSPPPYGISSLTQEPYSPPYQPPCLENDKAAQQLEIVKLKARVKKLEKINMVKSSKLRRLKKVGTSQCVESSDDMENVFNQERIIVDIDQDEGIELVLSMQEDDTEVQEAVEIVTTAKLLMIEVVTAAATQVVAASTPIPATKPKILNIAAVPAVSTRNRKGVIIRDPEEELHSDTLAQTPKVKEKGKGILIEAPKPIKKKDQIEMDAEYVRKLQKEINKEHEEAYKNIDWNAALDHVQSKEPQYIKRYHGMKKKPQTKSEARKNMIFYLKNTEGYKMDFFKGMTYDEILPIFQAKFEANMRFLFKSREEIEAEDQEIIKSINETPTQKAVKRRKLNEEAEDLRKRLEIVQNKDDDVFIEATPLAQKNFDREDLETLWRIVRDIFSTSKPTNFSDEYLLLTLKTMFEEPDGQDAIWRNQKSVHGLALVRRWKRLTSCGVHVITLLTV
nr:hypothetical protein [Tanacetum cinerariifolium]